MRATSASAITPAGQQAAVEPAAQRRVRRHRRRARAAVAGAALVVGTATGLGPTTPARAATGAGRSPIRTTGQGVRALALEAGLRTSRSRAARTAARAAAVADRGLVDIVATVAGGAQAGTGIVVTHRGEVITNYHVVAGETSLRVTDVANARTYGATVVGYDRSADVAVLQLTGASGLPTVKAATASVRIGTYVVAVGNAGGRGGEPTAAAGTVTATEQDVTAADDEGNDVESLTGLIGTSADVRAGDSGGALVTGAGKVVGVVVAAAVDDGWYGAPADATEGYAIPIDTALRVARAIELAAS